MSVSDIQKLSEKNQPKEIKKSEDELIKATDSKSKKNKLSELKKTGDEGKKLKGNESEKEKTKLADPTGAYGPPWAGGPGPDGPGGRPPLTTTGDGAPASTTARAG
jgi:hypothetical protein